MSIYYDKMNDDEKNKLRALKKDFDDGILSQQQYNQMRKKIELDIKNRIQWSLLPKPIWFLLFLGVFIGGVYVIYSIANNKTERLDIESANLRVYDVGKVMAEFKIINNKNIAITAGCHVSVYDKNKKLLASDTYDYAKLPIPANSSRSVMAQVLVNPGLEQAIDYHTIDCFVKK